jgi:2-octaprenylphenol hydroxylase
MMTSSNAQYSVQVAVAGGGIVGKAVALGLLQLGLSVALIDPKMNNLRGGALASPLFPRAYALSPGSQALFERLRVWQALDPSHLSPVYDMRIYGQCTSASSSAFLSGMQKDQNAIFQSPNLQHDEERADLHFSAFEARVPVLAWIVEESLLESALDAALSFQPQLLQYPTQVCALQTTQRGVTITLEDQRVLNAELLLGADGAQSFVRSQMGVGLVRRDYPQMGVIATFQTQKPHDETAYQWFDQGEILALLPLTGNRVSMVWSAQKEHAKALLALSGPQLAAAVQAKVGERFGRLECVIPGAAEDTTPSRGFALSRYSADRLIAPFMALVGDAAHGLHPLAGQGLNLGLGDVSTLLETLAQWQSTAFQPLGEWSVLRRYERARREEISKLLWATEGLYRLFSVSGPWAKGIRKAGMAFLNRSAFLKRQLIAQALGVHSGEK